MTPENNKTEASRLISEFVMTLLNERAEISFSELLTLTTEAFHPDLGETVSWHLLQVKQELLDKKMIKITFDKERVQRISLNNKPLKVFNILGQELKRTKF